MPVRRMAAVFVLMTTLVVVWTFCSRVSNEPIARDAKSRPDDKGKAAADTAKNRSARIRIWGQTPAPNDPANAKARAEGNPPGEQQPAKLSSAEIEKFLLRNQRNADSLRTVFLATGNTNYLEEAAANFPNDSKVQLSVLLQNVHPEERRKWLDAFKESSPENALANYLSAGDYFDSGQPEAAVKELLEATGTALYQDYTMDSIQALEELSRESDLSPWETRSAALAGWASEHMPELTQLKHLALGVAELRKQYQAAGDEQSVENLSRMAVTLAGRLNGGDQSQFTIKHPKDIDRPRAAPCRLRCAGLAGPAGRE